MKNPKKNILVYADGRVEEIKQDLVGARFIKGEMVDGALWRREFDVQCAMNAHDENGPYSMVALEVDFYEVHSAASWEEMQAKAANERMRRVMRGLQLVAEEDARLAEKESEGR